MADRLDRSRLTPRATYRLQFHKDFRFADAASLASYLSRLGVSHVYASPWLKARPGSKHGYDIVDHSALNPELGTQQDFDAMSSAFQENGLGQILDFVPNHMGVGGSDNPLWLDVLEWGPDAAFSGWFDIDWEGDCFHHTGKLLVPFLGDQYGAELYTGKLRLKFDEQDGSFAVWAYDTHKLPVCPLHYARILGDEHPVLERLGDEFASLPARQPQARQRARQLQAELAHAAGAEDVRIAIAAAVERFNGTAGVEATWHPLHELIQDQFWRAAYYRVAADDINYRRFFNINDLAGIRMELYDVFEHSHALVFRLLADGTLDGLRIDHVDGLLDPKEYFERLRSNESRPPYLIVEKILAPHESLRDDWNVDGTTGYEFTNLVLGLLIDPAGEEPFTKTYIDFTGERETFFAVVRECKMRIMRNEMASELNVLARNAVRVARRNPRTVDLTHNVLRRAIREVVACFPVYRTYLDTSGEPSEQDRRDLNWAMKRAQANDTEIDASVFDFVGKLLSGDLVAQGRSGFSRHDVLRFAMKLQQYSGPVMAKGLEDTAFYRYNRFIALNEVGGNPEQFGVNVAGFHKANSQRVRRWPKSMLTTSTHDTKLGEDARARMAVLSEIPQDWSAQVETWSRILRARAGEIGITAPPDRKDEYRFYQLLVATWPAEITGPAEQLDAGVLLPYIERLKGAITKSIREAKVRSTWVSPDRPYEDAVLAFVQRALDTDGSRAFFSTFLPFQERIARLGAQNSLVQTALKLTAPGIPDLYQGSELWDLSMVDPDNRRPVDYEQRMRLLDDLDRRSCLRELLDSWRDGRLKLLLTSRLLRFRAAHPDLFVYGSYEPLSVVGPQSDCVCAFARKHEGQSAVVLAARFPARRESGFDWGGTSIAIPRNGGSAIMREAISGAGIAVDSGAVEADVIFRKLPVAVLGIE